VYSHNLTAARLLALLVTVSLGLGVAACGGATSSSSSHALKRDRDNDSDNNDDDAHILSYGHAPSAAQTQEIASLVRRYYATAAGENGREACSMLYPLLSQSVAEEHGPTSGLRSTTCAEVLTGLFKQRHRVLVAESATLKVYRIRVKGDKALTLVSFATVPEVRQLLERRVNGTWKVAAVSDTILE
jgi:hypothetical protein